MMHRISWVLTLCFLMLVSPASAQVSELWSATYNGIGNGFDQIYAMVLDKDGNIYVTGSTYGGASSGVDMATIKYNSAGDSLWVKTYNGTGSSTDIGRSIAVDTLGNVFVTGESRNGTSSGSEDFLTIKYSPSGDTAWTRRYNGPGNGGDFATGLGLDDSGNVYVTGGSNGGATGNDITMIKYNTSGDEQWVRRFEGTANFGFSDWAYAIAVSPSGDAHAVGHADNLNEFWDFATVKYDRDGTKAWHKHYVGPVDNVSEQGEAITIDGAGNVYIAGSSNGPASSTDIVTVKYNSAGTEQWNHRFDFQGAIDDPKAIAVDGDGNVYVGGESGNNYVLIKYNAAGDSLWTRWYNGTANQTDQVYSIALNDAGEIYITGRSGGSGSGYDIVTIKYSAAGDSLWGVRYTGAGSANDEATVVKTDGGGHIYVAGMSTVSGQSGNFYLVKYGESVATSAGPSIAKQPSGFALRQNYPNPFNGITNLTVQLDRRSHMVLTVYDVLGRTIAVLADDVREAGTHLFQWNSAAAPTGVYWYRLTSGERTETKMMMMVK
ncbi:MAG: SBBP repeat-containing protein [Bacteroidota bacterium]